MNKPTDPSNTVSITTPTIPTVEKDSDAQKLRDIRTTTHQTVETLNKKLPFTFIDEETVRASIDLPSAYRAIEESYTRYSENESVTPKTTAMQMENGTLFCFLSHLNGHNTFIAKLATFFPKNRERGLPNIQPYISIFDAETGELRAIISAKYFAGVRTALTSLVGAKHLTDGNYRKIAIIGTGVQAKSHAYVFSHLSATPPEIRIFSPKEDSREKFIEECKNTLGEARVVTSMSSEEATRDADIIICVTDSPNPVISANHVKKGALIIAVGSMGAMQEVPDEVMSTAKVVMDSIAQCGDYGEIAGPRSRGHTVDIIGEIGTIIRNGMPEHTAGETIIFKHHGLPVTDAALAEHVLSRQKTFKQ